MREGASEQDGTVGVFGQVSQGQEVLPVTGESDQGIDDDQ